MSAFTTVGYRVANRAVIAILAALCFACVYTPPTSRRPGIYSATTGLPVTPAERQSVYRGYDDYKALSFEPARNCDESFHPQKHRWDDFRTASAAWQQGPTGSVCLTDAGLGIDEAEVTNLEWQRYQQQLSIPQEIAATQPLASALPVPDYFANRFYAFFPVVGVSYEQVSSFCRWRSAVTTRSLNRWFGVRDSLSPDYVRLEYRLPTEAEWELAAGLASGTPYGTSCPERPVKVDPKAASYLKQVSGSPATVNQITTDIKAYNEQAPVRHFVSGRQAEPYFLRLHTPNWAYQGPSNGYELYQMLGNAAEMVQEPGLTKGGSFRDPLDACTIKARGRYTGPAPTVGFRCVCEVSFPNRK